MNEGLMMQSVNVTVIGMLVVFAFLIILVCVMHIMGKAVAALEKYFPQPIPQAAAGTDNAPVAVAIAAAKRFLGK